MALHTFRVIRLKISFAQLVARVRAVLARSSGTASPFERLEAVDLQVDLATRRVKRDGKLVPLTPTEFKLLIALMRHPGEVVSPEELVRAVWGAQYKFEYTPA